jgi:hypothetical protein
MHYVGIALLVKLLVIIHIIKTERSYMWIWIVFLVPIFGPLAYIVVELLPEFFQTRAGYDAKRVVATTILPNKEIKEASQNYEILDTVENTTELADECVRKGLFEEGKKLYVQCLTGPYDTDADLMHGLARAEFGLNNFAEAKTILVQMSEKNPNFKNTDARLLMARTLDKLDETELAMREYEAIEGSFPGPEANFHHAMLLKRLGASAKANALFEDILKFARISSRHYRSTHKLWISQVKNELRDQEPS